MTDKTHTHNDVISFLQGTCSTLEVVLEKLCVEDTPELRAAIDDELFECETCDWWCERSEESPECPGICTDCHGEEEDDD